MQNSLTVKLCECGCGEPAPVARFYDSRTKVKPGQQSRFIKGHNARTPESRERFRQYETKKGRGTAAKNWAGGTTTFKGYPYVFKPEHPRANVKGYVGAHWLAMEAMIGRYLKPGEIVAFRDWDRSNVEPSNLLLFGSLSEFLSWRGGGDARPIHAG